MNSKYKFAYRGKTICGILAFLAFGLTALPAAAVIQGGGCVNDVSGLNNNCTANDLTFVAVGLGIQDDGCVSSTDTVSIFLRAQIANTTAQTRYDVGMYFATDGDPNNDGGESGICSREILKPASATVGAQDCPPLDLNSGFGPYLNADGDTCSDLLAESNPLNCTAQARVDAQGKTLRDAAIFDISEAIVFPCRDIELTPTGFVNIPLCSTWGNQTDQVTTDANATCDSELEAIPGTKSKCRCEDLDSNIPAPDLALSCTCNSPTTVRPGFPVTCTVNYTNNATCAPAAGTPERFQCGTAGFVRFDLDDNRMGLEAGTFAVNNDGRGTTAGTPGEIRWTPASDPQLTAGIVGQGETDSLEFVYTVSPDASDGPISITTQTQWSNTADFSTVVPQTLSTTCDITVDATHATVSSFTSSAQSGATVLEWQTASEAGTRGFDLYRQEASGWVKLNPQLLPATGELPGGSYRLLDPQADPQVAQTYKLVEEDVWGRRETHGPFRVTARRTELSPRRLQATAEAPAGTVFEARSKDLPEVDRERFATARRERETERETELSRSLGAAKKNHGANGATAPPRARVEVESTGLVEVSASELATAWGMPLADARKTIQQGKVRVTGLGQDIGWHAADLGNGDSDGDGIVFYGEAIESLFTGSNAYFVEADRGPDMPTLRVNGKSPTASSPTPPDSFTDTVRLEEDVLARPVVGESTFDDYWFWTGLIQGHPTLGSWSQSFDLPGALGAGAGPATGDASLTVRFRGQTTDLSGPDQRAEVRLNGASLGEVSWEGQRDHDESFSFPQSLLSGGGGQTLEILALEGNFFVDSFAVTYARGLEALDGRLAFPAEGRSVITVDGFSTADIALYDITDPRAVQRILGATVEPGRITFEPPNPQGSYLAIEAGATLTATAVETDHPSDWKNPAQRADYLVIAPAELAGAAEALVEYRRGRGLEARLVVLQDLYDEFQHGVRSPEAIRAFLAYAHGQWELAPRYVTVVGKGSYDYRDLFGRDGNLFPPRMVASRHGLVPSDSSYAIFDGSPLPAMAVGRLPVVSAAELTAVVDKIVAYETSGGGAWTGRALLIADNPDTAGDFAADSDGLASHLPSSVAAEKIYLGQPLTLAEARQRTADGFRDGARFVSYVGHGGFDRFAAEGILTRVEVPSLDNGDRLPVVAALTCNLGMFAFPGFSSLGEALVIEADGGGAAVWGPMGLSLNAEATALGRHLLPALAASDGQRLGDRLLGSLDAYLAAGGNPEMGRLYGLLGDAALETP